MALTKPAGIAMRLFAIPFIAIGFVLLLVVVMTLSASTATLADNLPTMIRGAISLLLGVWMLKSGASSATLARSWPGQGPRPTSQHNHHSSGTAPDR
jgi:uncharacterized RDD family membrane protein YckC